MKSSLNIEVNDTIKAKVFGCVSLCYVWSVPSKYFKTFGITVKDNIEKKGIEKSLTIKCENILELVEKFNEAQ